MSNQFKREVRYNVIKLKTGMPVNCVVVEEDWPEYEIVWQMIQDRVEGKPNEWGDLKQQLAEAKKWKDAIEDELIVDCILDETHLADPRKALEDAILWNIQVALDPQVSSEARALIDRGRAESQARIKELEHGNHNLKWALGSEGYPTMVTPDEQAEYEAAQQGDKK